MFIFLPGDRRMPRWKCHTYHISFHNPSARPYDMYTTVCWNVCNNYNVHGSKSTQLEETAAAKKPDYACQVLLINSVKPKGRCKVSDDARRVVTIANIFLGRGRNETSRRYVIQKTPQCLPLFATKRKKEIGLFFQQGRLTDIVCIELIYAD